MLGLLDDLVRLVRRSLPGGRGRLAYRILEHVFVRPEAQPVAVADEGPERLRRRRL